MNSLVTGGASGLGEAITRQLALESKGTVYFTWNSSMEKAKILESEFSNVKGVYCNFSDNNSIKNLLEAMNEMSLGVLVNNAFSGLTTNYFHKIDTNYFEQNFIHNISPVLGITQKAILHFRKQKFGKIITILTSYLVSKPPIGLSEYVASKAYLHSLSKSWAVENAKFNITSNCISPSTMQTALIRDTDQRIIDEIQASHPLKQLLKTEEVAKVVMFLVNASQQINGENIIINAASDID